MIERAEISQTPERFMKNGVAVIGGGPAGAFAAYCLGKEDIPVKIFEPRSPHPPNREGGEKRHPCTGCAGWLQNNALALLRAHGIELPEDIIVPLEGASIHLPSVSEELHLDLPETVAVFRGWAPVNQPEGGQTRSFDAFLLNLAIQQARAEYHPTEVKEINLQGEKAPVLIVDADGMEHKADFIVGAFGYRPQLMRAITYPSAHRTMSLESPRTQRASVREYVVEDALVQALANRVHVFGNPTDNIWFAAMIPKPPYISVVLMGRKDIEKEDFDKFFAQTPAHEMIGEYIMEHNLEPNCGCLCPITLKSPRRFMVEGTEGNITMVNIGDAGPTRPRKNGLFAALDGAARLAEVLIQDGNSSRSLRRYAEYMNRTYVWDNYWAEITLRISDLILNHEFSRNTIVALAKNNIPFLSPAVNATIQDLVTGSVPYWTVPFAALRAAFSSLGE